MQIVADRGMDISPEQTGGIDIHYLPLRIMLDGVTYVSGIDIQPEQFYQLLSKTESFPTTSQPSAGEFAELYRELAKTDPEILSVHISSGLSGTINAARAGAAMVPEANVTLVDSLTLSCPFGWQMEAALRGLREGWSLDRILIFMEEVRLKTIGIFTLSNLNYLVHGGRISHMKGLLASLLNIKPIITVSPEDGKYVLASQDMTFKRALQRIVSLVQEKYVGCTDLRVQLLHAYNPEGVEILHEKISQAFNCQWLPTVNVAPALGAHTGPSMVGLAAGPVELFAPWKKA